MTSLAMQFSGFLEKKRFHGSIRNPPQELKLPRLIVPDPSSLVEEGHQLLLVTTELQLGKQLTDKVQSLFCFQSILPFVSYFCGPCHVSQDPLWPEVLPCSLLEAVSFTSCTAQLFAQLSHGAPKLKRETHSITES